MLSNPHIGLAFVVPGRGDTLRVNGRARLIREALDCGMNFMDNSWDYNNGEGEIRIGNALRDGNRQKAFLMTKFDGRKKESAMQ